MKSLTISEGFRQAIGDRKVLHGFFSTYCFEPDFFELEVLPLLLGSPALSSNETIRYFQLQELTRAHQDRFAVAYDFDVFNPQLASRLEIRYLPIRVKGGCQHSKIAVLEVENSDGAPTSLILVAGSFNLTKAGWWENIEVGHWVELSDKSAPSNIVQPLARALDYFNRRQPSPVLEALKRRLGSLPQTKDNPDCAFYFSGSGSRRLHFADFINARARGKGSIEIISPFFAEDGNDEEISEFLSQFKSASLLLPLDERGNALIKDDVYKDLSARPVEWCRWRPQLLANYEVPRAGSVFRKLHAKIYQCLGAKPWVFVGSVNLSHKAFKSNVEAGFLLSGSSCGSFLVKDEQESHRFEPQSEAGPAQPDGILAMPVIQLVYDWLTAELQLISSDKGELTLLDSAGDALKCFRLEKDTQQIVTFDALKGHLERSALIEATWQVPNEEGSARRKLLISQRNLFCRPSALPAMNLQDLLRVFQGMHPARRAELIGDLAARLIRLQQDGGLADQYAPPALAKTDRPNFFSEFSQVNGAFWTLKQHLEDARQAKRQDILDYYLKGCQPDSLRGVLDSLQPANSGTAPSLIVRYLTLLSLDELLDIYADLADSTLAREVHERIAETEREKEFDDIKDKERFLAFVKDRFRMPVKELILASKSRRAEHAGD